MQSWERRVATPLTTPPRAVVALGRGAHEDRASFALHNTTLPSGLSPITGNHSPYAALDESDPDAFLNVAPCGSPSPLPKVSDAYYRPHPRRPPPPTHEEEDDEPSAVSGSTDAESEEGGGRRSHPVISQRPDRVGSPVWRPRLSQALQGDTVKLQSTARPESCEWRASLTRGAAAQTTTTQPVPMRYPPRASIPIPLANTGLNISPSPARGGVAASERKGDRPGTAPPPPQPEAAPANTLEAFRRAQVDAQRAQDQCMLRRAAAQKEEYALRQALEEEARLASQLRLLESRLQYVSSPLAQAGSHNASAGPLPPHVYDDVERQIQHIAGLLHTPDTNTRARQRWDATHVPHPGTFSPLAPQSPLSCAQGPDVLEREVERRYRLSKLVVALDEEREKTTFLRARHKHLLEAYQQRTQTQPQRTSTSPKKGADNEDTSQQQPATSPCSNTSDESARQGAAGTGDLQRLHRPSLFCGGAATDLVSQQQPRPARGVNTNGGVPERTQTELAEDLNQIRENLAAIHALAASQRTDAASLASPDASETAEEGTEPISEIDTVPVADASGDSHSSSSPPPPGAAQAQWRAALAENKTLRHQFAQIVRSSEDELAALMEYYELLLAKLAQRLAAVSQMWKATSQPPPSASGDDVEPVEQRSRLVSWF